jgi:hypothetical protein
MWDTLCGQNAELLIVKAGGTYSYHCYLKSKYPTLYMKYYIHCNLNLVCKHIFRSRTYLYVYIYLIHYAICIVFDSPSNVRRKLDLNWTKFWKKIKSLATHISFLISFVSLCFFAISVISGDKMAAILRRKTSSGSGIDVMLWFVILPLVVMATR